MSPEFNKPIRQTLFVAELKCYLCGSVSGSIESEQALTPAHSAPRVVRLRRPGQAEASAVADWRQVRCVRCGGPVYLDETDVVTRRIEEYNWTDERPRRGRPPKRLIEERRREALESQAA